MNYLIVTSEGECYKADRLTDDVLERAYSGMLNIIDIFERSYFSDGEWVDLTEFTI